MKKRASVTFSFYRGLMPILLFLARCLRFVHPKLSQGFRLRREEHWRNHPPLARAPIWFHCASGEFEYAKPVIELIKQRLPEIPVLVTYFSPSIHQSLQEHPQVDLALPLPFDLVDEWQSFLKHHRPRCLAVARTDVWPEMMVQVQQASIPSLLFSATLVASSGRQNRWLHSFYGEVYSRFSQIYCVGEDDQKQFARLGPLNNLRVAGDTRYDQVFRRLQAPRPIQQNLFEGKDRAAIFIAGSTWSEDEEAILEGFAAVKVPASDWRLIVAPHEPTPGHLQQLENSLREKRLSFTRYSAASDWSEDVLVVDQVGILAELYRFAGMAFVGGSFRKTVHSVMEPLSAGCPTLVGPFHQNNREAIEFSRRTLDENLSAVTVVENAEQITAALSRWSQSGTAVHLREKLIQLLEQKRGASEQVFRWFQQLPAPLTDNKDLR